MSPVPRRAGARLHVPPRGQRLCRTAPATGRHKPLAPSPAGQGLLTAPRARLEVLVFQHGAHHQLLVAEVPEGSHVEGHVGEDNQVLQESEDGVNWQGKRSRLVGCLTCRTAARFAPRHRPAWGLCCSEPG